MKVFISWSGESSRFIAEELKNWLKLVIQSLEPWISTGIEKGRRWNPDIAQELEMSQVGIFCLTKENLTSPWLHFEAGAISKTKEAYVCTLLYNLKPSDIKPPLSDFQATVFEKEDLFKLLQTINGKLTLNGNGLNEETLKVSFNTFWPYLSDRLKNITHSSIDIEEVRPERELIEESVDILRNLQAYIYSSSSGKSNKESLPPSISYATKKSLVELLIKEWVEEFKKINKVDDWEITDSYKPILDYIQKNKPLSEVFKPEIIAKGLKNHLETFTENLPF